MDSVLILKVGIGGINLSKSALAGGIIAFLGFLSAFSHFSRKEAENIGVKLDAGLNATVFTLPDGDTLKIVRLDNENNLQQAKFINEYIQKTKSGEWRVCKALPTYYYFNAGFANMELEEQMEEENTDSDLLVRYNEDVAMWVTPTYKTKGVFGRNEELSTKIQEALDELQSWGEEYGVKFSDLHSQNYGLDDKGNIIFFDFDSFRMKK
jgi:hypothetical protein